MSRSIPDIPYRFYNGDPEPRGHTAAYVVVFLVFGIAGLLVAASLGWILLPFNPFLKERPRSTTPSLTSGIPPQAVPADTRLVQAVGPPGALDWDIPRGHFFTQTNGQPPRTSTRGYAVTNSEGIPFWDTFQELGGVERLGYPLSRRFVWRGLPTQVFQRAVLQWRDGRMEHVNIMDELSAMNKDDWLLAERGVPKPLEATFDQGRSWSQVIEGRLALLDSNPSFKATYFAIPDPLRLYGLPASRAVDMGGQFAMRLQRAVFQQWKMDTQWARAGDVTLMNVGALAIEAGIFPPEALEPEEPPLGALPLSTPTPLVAASSNNVEQATPGAIYQRVGNTGGYGVYLRRTPRMEDKLLAWPENTRVEILGEEQVDGVLWRKVRDPAGNVGWIPAQYLVAP